MLAIDRRQVGVRGVRFHPHDLDGEEREGIYADTQGASSLKQL
jgi:hypothetical protein